jgi:hypothetical protein
VYYSGCLTLGEMQASWDLFETSVADAGHTIDRVINTNENWILPFLTTLSPNEVGTVTIL